jgi:hypothetical protein
MRRRRLVNYISSHTEPYEAATLGDVTQAFYFTHVRPAATFDVVVDGTMPDIPILGPGATRHH